MDRNIFLIAWSHILANQEPVVYEAEEGKGAIEKWCGEYLMLCWCRL